jgi:hypothetical protein
MVPFLLWLRYLSDFKVWSRLGSASIFTLLKHPSYLVHCIFQLIYHFGILALLCMEDNYSTYVTNWHFGVCEEDGYSRNSYKAVTDTDDLVCTFTIKYNWDLYFSVILWEFLTDILGPIGCPEIAVRNYHFMLRDILEERRSCLLHGGSLKSHKKKLTCRKAFTSSTLHSIYSLFLHVAATGCDHLQGAPNFID